MNRPDRKVELRIEQLGTLLGRTLDVLSSKIYFSGTKLPISPNLSHSSLFQIDILGLIVACISHDLDHRGTNNSFQHKMNNPLAKLYSTSTLERHHLNQCLLILTLRGNQILDNLTKVQDGNYEWVPVFTTAI